jgi:hypothetical protein
MRGLMGRARAVLAAYTDQWLEIQALYGRAAAPQARRRQPGFTMVCDRCAAKRDRAALA